MVRLPSASVERLQPPEFDGWFRHMLWGCSVSLTILFLWNACVTSVSALDRSALDTSDSGCEEASKEASCAVVGENVLRSRKKHRFIFMFSHAKKNKVSTQDQPISLVIFLELLFVTFKRNNLLIPVSSNHNADSGRASVAQAQMKKSTTL